MEVHHICIHIHMSRGIRKCCRGGLDQPQHRPLDTPTHMDMDTDMVDFHTPTTHMPTMERDQLKLRPKLTQRPMLTPIFSTVDTTDLTLIMLVTTHTPTDIHTPMDFGERSKSK